MRSCWIGLGGFALALLCLVPPSSAQYMYLDSDGDGVHTAGDVLHAVGPTVVDIWLDIGHNRDGSVTTCKALATEPLNMFAYVVDLSATGGTVSYSAYTNRIQEMGPVGSPKPSDGTNFSTGAFFTAGTAVLPPGKYLLGTLTVFAVSGTPSIQIVPGGDPAVFGDRTAFGSQCDGTDFPNTIALGTDWFDADGLAFEAGGTENGSPSLVPPAGMVVNSGENATQTLAASDPEGQPLIFSKASGPGFMFVATTVTGSGSAGGEVRLAPFVSDVGSTTADVSVTDGSASDHADFSITVSRGANHPPFFAPIPPMTVAAGEISKILLTAGDPDGGAVHFTKISGPLYLSLRELASRPGGASAVVTLAPAVCDVGTATATFSVTDGVASVERSTAISVAPPPVDPGVAIRHFNAGFMNGIAIADLNRDGNLDVVAAEEDQRSISVLLGDGAGNLAPAVRYPVAGQNAAIAIADFNRDGAPDVAVTDPAAGDVEILLGRGDGTLVPDRNYDTAAGAIGIVAVDLNRDGIPDLISVNQETSSASVLIGVGDGTFGTKRDSPAGFTPTAFAIGDFNLDGRLDVA
ncbi:MAG: VCBS repeat-containing protein, partial [Thermoplasmata archaeon]|nr:VCBS repeat-containing protein [Thermoplasmata archaeon]